MRNRYFPQDTPQLAARLSESKVRLAELEHAYLMAMLSHQKLLRESTPMLASHAYAFNGEMKIQKAILEMYKGEPLLASLPLIEMKANLAIQMNPAAEQEARILNKIRNDTPHLYPIPLTPSDNTTASGKS